MKNDYKYVILLLVILLFALTLYLPYLKCSEKIKSEKIKSEKFKSEKIKSKKSKNKLSYSEIDTCPGSTKGCGYLDVYVVNNSLEEVYVQLTNTSSGPLTQIPKSIKYGENLLLGSVKQDDSEWFSIFSEILTTTVTLLASVELGPLDLIMASIDGFNTITDICNEVSSGVSLIGNISIVAKELNGKTNSNCKTIFSYFTAIQPYCFAEGGEVKAVTTPFLYYNDDNKLVAISDYIATSIKSDSSYDTSGGCVTVTITNTKEQCINPGEYTNGLISGIICDSNIDCFELLKKKDGTHGTFYPQKSYYDFLECNYNMNKKKDEKTGKNPDYCYFGVDVGSSTFKYKKCDHIYENRPLLLKNQDICDYSLRGVGFEDENIPGKCMKGLCPVKQQNGSYTCQENNNVNKCDYSITKCGNYIFGNSYNISLPEQKLVSNTRFNILDSYSNYFEFLRAVKDIRSEGIIYDQNNDIYYSFNRLFYINDNTTDKEVSEKLQKLVNSRNKNNKITIYKKSSSDNVGISGKYMYAGSDSVIIKKVENENEKYTLNNYLGNSENIITLTLAENDGMSITFNAEDKKNEVEKVIFQYDLDLEPDPVPDPNVNKYISYITIYKKGMDYGNDYYHIDS